ncbi:MAG: hypothetical protein ABR599_07945 [Gemmatimonadota bacterium]
MRSRVVAGALAGIAAGLVFGVIMHAMSAPTPDGGRMPMMVMVAMIVGSQSLAVGWIYHLFNSAVIGALFGALLGGRARGYGSGAGWGAAWGVVWWVVGGLILMPVLLGMPPFAALRMPPMRPLAIGSLLGHLMYGLILGATFVRLRRPRAERLLNLRPTAHRR